MQGTIHFKIIRAGFYFCFIFPARLGGQGSEYQRGEAPLHLLYPQGVQGVPGASPQLQELVHSHLHIFQYPPMLILLGC